MNDSNLTPFRAGETRAVEAGRKGGVASGVARRERFKTLLLAELDGEAQRFVPPPTYPMSAEDILDEGHYEPAGYSVRASLVKALVAKAEAGDMKALALIMSLDEADEADAGSLREA